MTHPIAARLTPPDYEHVPTVEELAREGHARPVVAKRIDRETGKVTTDTRWRISETGQRLIKEAMHRNAARGRRFDIERLVEAA